MQVAYTCTPPSLHSGSCVRTPAGGPAAAAAAGAGGAYGGARAAVGRGTARDVLARPADAAARRRTPPPALQVCENAFHMYLHMSNSSKSIFFFAPGSYMYARRGPPGVRQHMPAVSKPSVGSIPRMFRLACRSPADKYAPT